MKSKIFKTLDEQIEILSSKGLMINDIRKAKEALIRENYFFVSGYRHLFMRSDKDNTFIKGTTFEELYGMFLFDRKVRNIMFKYILVVENNLKSIISYELSRKYGYKEKDYLDPKNFTQDAIKTRQVKDVLNKMKRQIRVNGRKHTATMHYIDNYGYIPMWILVKVLSLGIISELYSILKSDDRMFIAELYKMDAETLGIYISLLANYRNICAHEDILYDYRTQRQIPDNKYHRMLDIDKTDGEYIFGKNDLFALIIMLKQMISEEEFHDLIGEVSYEVDHLDGIVDVVPLNRILNRIGFPDNWHDIVDLA